MVVVFCCAVILPLQVGSPFLPSWFRPYAMPLSTLMVVAMFATILLINKITTGAFLPARQKYEGRRPRPRISNIAGIMIFVFPLIYLGVYCAVGRLFPDSVTVGLAMAAIAFPVSFITSDRLYDRILAARSKKMREKQG